MVVASRHEQVGFVQRLSCVEWRFSLELCTKGGWFPCRNFDQNSWQSCLGENAKQMSHFSIIRDTSNEIRTRLFDALTSVADVDFGLSDLATNIILQAPAAIVPEGARLSIYLYHIEPDPNLRNQRALSIDASGILRAPMALRLRYLITPLLDAEDRSQLMLGRIIQAFHDMPFIDEAAGDPLGDSLGGGTPELRISFDELDLESLARIWHALASDYRLSVAYLVRVVVIDSQSGVADGRRVAATHVALETKR